MNEARNNVRSEGNARLDLWACGRPIALPLRSRTLNWRPEQLRNLPRQRRASTDCINNLPLLLRPLRQYLEIPFKGVILCLDLEQVLRLCFEQLGRVSKLGERRVEAGMEGDVGCNELSDDEGHGREQGQEGKASFQHMPHTVIS